MSIVGGAIEAIPFVGGHIRSGLDDLAGRARALRDGTDPEEEAARIDERYQASAEEYPVSNVAGQLVGGTLAMAPVAATATGARALGIVGKNLATRTSLAAGSGAAIAAGDAAMRGEDVGTAAAVGAGIGAVSPVVGDVIGNGVETVLNGVRAGNAATRQIARSMVNDGFDEASLARKLDELGPDAMIADAGPNLRGDLEGIANKPGAGKEIAKRKLSARDDGAEARIRADADETLGGSTDAYERRLAIIEQRQAEARDLFDTAYSAPFKASERQVFPLKKKNGSGPEALRRAARMAEDEGAPFPMKPVDPNKPDAGETIDINALGVRELHYVAQVLDDKISAALVNSPNEARALTNLRDNILRDMPESFDVAMNAYAGRSRLMDALKKGQGVWSMKQSASELRSEMQTMTDGERELLIEGARDGLAVMMENVRNPGNKVRALFREDGAAMRKLGVLLGADKAKQFMRALERETEFTQTSYLTSGNSRTAERAANQEAWADGGSNMVGVVEELFNFQTGTAGRKAVGALGSRQSQKSGEALRADGAEVLTGRDVDALGRSRSRMDENRATAETAAGATTAGAGGPGRDQSR
ncbi:MAG: hypothetical protein AAF449_00780, partial [Myxococcota bacterium]